MYLLLPSSIPADIASSATAYIAAGCSKPKKPVTSSSMFTTLSAMALR